MQVEQSKRQIGQQERETTLQAATALIDRRTLLVRGSAGALGIMGMGLWSAASASTQTASARSAPPFSIGYWDGSGRDALTDTGVNAVERPFLPDVTAAHQLPSGDRAAFGTHAEVIVYGLYGESLLPRPKSLVLQASYTLQGENGPISMPFRAWHYTEVPHAHVNHATRFRMPLLPEAGLRFSLCQTATGPTASRSMRETCVRLTEGDERGAMKLRPGVYFIPLHSPEAGIQPVWHRYQYRAISAEEPTPSRRLCCRTLRGVRPVGFDYLMVSISPIS